MLSNMGNLFWEKVWYEYASPYIHGMDRCGCGSGRNCSWSSQKAGTSTKQPCWYPCWYPCLWHLNLKNTNRKITNNPGQKMECLLSISHRPCIELQGLEDSFPLNISRFQGLWSIPVSQYFSGTPASPTVTTALPLRLPRNGIPAP